MTIPPDHIRDLAATVLTEKQLDAWLLETRGLPQRAIAWHLDLSRSATIDRLDSAHRALRKAGVRMDLGTGNYYLEENDEPIPKLPPQTASTG